MGSNAAHTARALFGVGRHHPQAQNLVNGAPHVHTPRAARVVRASPLITRPLSRKTARMGAKLELLVLSTLITCASALGVGAGAAGSAAAGGATLASVLRQARCMGTAGPWCGGYYLQTPVERRPSPIYDRRACPRDCSGVGVCHRDTGVCHCPAGGVPVEVAARRAGMAPACTSLGHRRMGAGVARRAAMILPQRPPCRHPPWLPPCARQRLGRPRLCPTPKAPLHPQVPPATQQHGAQQPHRARQAGPGLVGKGLNLLPVGRGLRQLGRDAGAWWLALCRMLHATVATWDASRHLSTMPAYGCQPAAAGARRTRNPSHQTAAPSSVTMRRGPNSGPCPPHRPLNPPLPQTSVGAPASATMTSPPATATPSWETPSTAASLRRAAAHRARRQSGLAAPCLSPAAGWQTMGGATSWTGCRGGSRMRRCTAPEVGALSTSQRCVGPREARGFNRWQQRPSWPPPRGLPGSVRY
jgi:hypothetical protein